MARKSTSGKQESAITGQKAYHFSIIGTSPLLMHADDVMSADALAAWRKDPANKRRSVAGDDRSPTWTWLTYLYSDSGKVVMPSENLLAMVSKGGSSFKSGRMGTLKAEVAASILFRPAYPLLIGVDYHELLMSDVEDCKADDVPFSEQMARARELGFGLDVRRASVSTSKHVRVRPRFARWKVEGEFDAADDGALSEGVLQQLFSLCGRRVGLGDWRPSAPKKPGPYGMFMASVEEV